MSAVDQLKYVSIAVGSTGGTEKISHSLILLAIQADAVNRTALMKSENLGTHVRVRELSRMKLPKECISRSRGATECRWLLWGKH